MDAKSTLGSIVKKIRVNKRAILKRISIYMMILLILAPFIYTFRADIYSKFLVRYDEWYVWYGDDGIPTAEYGYQAGQYVGPQVTARIVANAAFWYHGQMERGNTTCEQFFINSVNWLAEHITIEEVSTQDGVVEIAHWYFDFAIWDMPAGWYQAMTDAKGLSILALAYSLYGNTTYFDICQKLVKSFEVPISFGGNVHTLDDGGIWYPEYIVPLHIQPDYKPKLILNGFLIGVENLYTANLQLNQTDLEEVFELGVNSAAANLHKYDSPYNWTLYHLDYPVKYASRGYHQIHIDLVYDLYEYTNITIFKTYGDKWSTYTNPPSITIEDLLSPDFLYYGVVMVILILGPLILVDIIQHYVRNYLRTKTVQ